MPVSRRRRGLQQAFKVIQSGLCFVVWSVDERDTQPVVKSQERRQDDV